MTMISHIDLFASEASDGSEWSLSGWAFIPGDVVSTGRMELDGEKIGSISCRWARPDVLAAFPSECPSEDVGFMAHVLLPPGLKPGAHRLELIFLNKENQEIGRLNQALVTDSEIPKSLIPGRSQSPIIPKRSLQADYLDLLEKVILGLPYTQGKESSLRIDGRDWPAFAHSMIGLERLHHLRVCAETALVENVPGDFIETGVWRGGACILLRGVLQAYHESSRNVWVADSFEGLPKPNPEKYPADAGDIHHSYQELAISLDQVKDNFDRYGLLDGQVKFLKGWFCQTLPDAPVDRLALLRLDGDMYESTMDALTYLYPKLSPRGFCIIDDYGCISACRAAVRDYRAAHGITAPMTMIDWTAAWWRKTA